MIDTIVFKIDSLTSPELKVWRYTIPETNIRRTGADNFRGNIRNMQISENINGVRVWGSIAKFYNGNNIEPFSRQMYCDAVKLFEKETGLNLKNAKMVRVDFGKSMIMKNDTAEYLRLFDWLPRYKQQFEKGKTGIETVTYHTKTGAFSFCAYDKIKEMQDDAETIPDLYKDCDVLRTEYRITNSKGIREKLGNGRNISPYELAEKETYRKLEKLYFDFYDVIPKKGRQVFFDKNRQYTPSEYFEILLESKRQSDPQFSKELLDRLFKNGNITEKNRRRILEQEKKNAQNYAISDTNELITELNEKTHCRAD